MFKLVHRATANWMFMQRSRVEAKSFRVKNEEMAKRILEKCLYTLHQSQYEHCPWFIKTDFIWFWFLRQYGCVGQVGL